MKRTDVCFEKDCFCRDFLKDCLLNPYVGDEYMKTVNRLVRKARDVDELVDLVLGEESLKLTQAYAEISKRKKPSGHWKRVREMFGDRQFKTKADSGGLKLGCGGFTVICPAGCGDGTVRVAIFKRGDDFNSAMMDFFTTCEGEKIGIYDYDCGETLIDEISGMFALFTYPGFVAIKEI